MVLIYSSDTFWSKAFNEKSLLELWRTLEALRKLPLSFAREVKYPVQNELLLSAYGNRSSYLVVHTMLFLERASMYIEGVE